MKIRLLSFNPVTPRLLFPARVRLVGRCRAGLACEGAAAPNLINKYMHFYGRFLPTMQTHFLAMSLPVLLLYLSFFLEFGQPTSLFCLLAKEAFHSRAGICAFYRERGSKRGREGEEEKHGAFSSAGVGN